MRAFYVLKVGFALGDVDCVSSSKKLKSDLNLEVMIVIVLVDDELNSLGIVASYNSLRSFNGSESITILWS